MSINYIKITVILLITTILCSFQCRGIDLKKESEINSYINELTHFKNRNQKSNNFEKDNDNIIQESNYLPLNKGNIWIYKYTSLDSNGNIINESLDTIKVLKDTIFNRIKYYKVLTFGKIIYYLTKNDTSILDREYLNKNITDHHIILKLPIKLNETFNNNNNKLGTKCISLNDTISILNKRIECIKYIDGHYNNSIGNFTILYFSNNIGLIRSEEWEFKDSKSKILHNITELIDYNIQK